MEVLYTKEHEWIKIEGTSGTIGITDYAQNQLGDITFVDLPNINNEVSQAGTLCAIESVKAASDIYAPVGCKVTAVNETLVNTPEIINDDPLGEGWIAQVEITDLNGKNNLLTEEAYNSYLKELN